MTDEVLFCDKKHDGSDRKTDIKEFMDLMSNVSPCCKLICTAFNEEILWNAVNFNKLIKGFIGKCKPVFIFF
jgi:hypothetical protein